MIGSLPFQQRQHFLTDTKIVPRADVGIASALAAALSPSRGGPWCGHLQCSILDPPKVNAPVVWQKQE